MSESRAAKESMGWDVEGEEWGEGNPRPLEDASLGWKACQGINANLSAAGLLIFPLPCQLWICLDQRAFIQEVLPCLLSIIPPPH